MRSGRPNPRQSQTFGVRRKGEYPAGIIDSLRRPGVTSRLEIGLIETVRGVGTLEQTEIRSAMSNVTLWRPHNRKLPIDDSAKGLTLPHDVSGMVVTMTEPENRRGLFAVSDSDQLAPCGTIPRPGRNLLFRMVSMRCLVPLYSGGRRGRDIVDGLQRFRNPARPLSRNWGEMHPAEDFRHQDRRSFFVVRNEARAGNAVSIGNQNCLGFIPEYLLPPLPRVPLGFDDESVESSVAIGDRDAVNKGGRSSENLLHKDDPTQRVCALQYPVSCFFVQHEILSESGGLNDRVGPRQILSLREPTDRFERPVTGRAQTVHDPAFGRGRSRSPA